MQSNTLVARIAAFYWWCHSLSFSLYISSHIVSSGVSPKLSTNLCEMRSLLQFQFVNSFLSLFYIAFYLQDQEKLKEVRLAPCLKLWNLWRLNGCLLFAATRGVVDRTPGDRQHQGVGIALLPRAAAPGQAELRHVRSAHSVRGDQKRHRGSW